jgi:uncharacterized cupin superfamily protein
MLKKNIYSGPWRESAQGEKFQREHLSLTDMDGGHGLGCSGFRVKPGKRAFPRHAHLANDEAIFVVAGRGSLTVGEETATVAAGDFIMLPRGEAHAHVLVNDGDEDLLYLCMSTTVMPEVVHYPDTGKLGVLGSTDFWKGGAAGVSGFYTPHPVGYWDGEDGA